MVHGTFLGPRFWNFGPSFIHYHEVVWGE